jgi:glycosyltransferase involved in cell wall biosynthesis
MELPFFSIIIPTLNEEKYLPQLLNDLKKQVYQDFEVIIVDGRSEDKTIKKAQRFKKDLDLKIVTSKIRHVSVQRNLGADQANGRVLLFMDADNQLPEEFILGIRYQLERFRPRLFTCYLMADTEKAADKITASVMNFSMEIFSNFEEASFAMGAFIGCSKSAFKKIGGFSENVDYGEDGDFVRRAFKLGFEFRIFHHPRFTYSFRRIRKEGKLNMLRKTTKLTYRLLSQKPLKTLEKDYPMAGGKWYEQKKSKKLNQQLNKAFKELKDLFS